MAPIQFSIRNDEGEYFIYNDSLQHHTLIKLEPYNYYKIHKNDLFLIGKEVVKVRDVMSDFIDRQTPGGPVDNSVSFIDIRDVREDVCETLFQKMGEDVGDFTKCEIEFIIGN